MAVSCDLGQIQKSKLADHPDMITKLSRYVTSPPHDADVKGDIFRHTIYPPSLFVTAFIFSRLESGGGGGGGGGNPPPAGRRRPKSPVLKRLGWVSNVQDIKFLKTTLLPKFCFMNMPMYYP